MPVVNLLEPRAVGNYYGKKVELEPEHKKVLENLSYRYNFDKGLIDFPTVIYVAGFQRAHPCGGGRSYLFMDFDGKLYPCPFCRVEVADVSLKEKVCLA